MVSRNRRFKENEVGKYLSLIYEACRVWIKVTDQLHKLHGFLLFKTQRDGRICSMEPTRVVLTALQELIQELHLHLAIFPGRQLLNHIELTSCARELGNTESVGALLLKRWVLWRRGCDVIKDSFINGKVHEADAELALDFILLFDDDLDDHTHLLYGIHLGLLGHKDPVFEHFVKI